MKVKRTIDVALPGLPNYLRLANPGADSIGIDVAELEDEELRLLGAEWTLALVAHAKKRRTRPAPAAQAAQGEQGE